MSHHSYSTNSIRNTKTDIRLSSHISLIVLLNETNRCIVDSYQLVNSMTLFFFHIYYYSSAHVLLLCSANVFINYYCFALLFVYAYMFLCSKLLYITNRCSYENKNTYRVKVEKTEIGIRP